MTLDGQLPVTKFLSGNQGLLKCEIEVIKKLKHMSTCYLTMCVFFNV